MMVDFKFGMKMLSSAFGFHVMIKWRAPAALPLNCLSLFVIVVTSNVTDVKDIHTAVGVLYDSTSALHGCSISG